MSKQGSNYCSTLRKLQSGFKLLQLQSCKSYRKCWAFFSRENIIHPHIFHIISIFYSLIAYYYQKKYCLYPKLHCKMQKMLCSSGEKKKSPAVDLTPCCTMHFYCKVNLKGQFKCWKVSFMFDVIFLDIYENPRRKNFINPSCPKHP